MRVGSNPEKFNNAIVQHAYHRVVVPVYIPNFEGYFKEAFQIFKWHIESLLHTIHPKTRITIFNNNCTAEIKDYIDSLYVNYPAIDQVIHSKENLGKINAILASVKGNVEPLITITDADVLFKHHWQQAVEQVFLNFPKAGLVSPVPSSKAFNNYTANNWFYGILGKGKIRFDNVQDALALKRFDASIGTHIQLYKPIHLQKYMVLRSKEHKAVMGCGHFVATLKRDVFDKGSNEPAFIKIQGGVEGKFIDAPNEKLGYLRLATVANYAYHLGNTTEDWMQDEFDSLKKETAHTATIDVQQIESKPLHPIYLHIGKFIRKVLTHKTIRNFYFKRIGLANPNDY